MKDIVEIAEGEDLLVMDSQVPKAGNVVAVQLGDLEYSQDFGCDKRFFLESSVQIQNESFKSYVVQRLTESQVNVAEVMDLIDNLFTKYTYYFSNQDGQGGLIT